MANKALLVIDFQQGLATGAYRELECADVINQLAKHIRAQNGIVVYIQHCHGTFQPLMKGDPGWALHASLQVEKQDHRVEKTASDAFYKTGLNDLLSEHGVDEVWVAGLQTEYCVDTTCRSALSKDYAVTLVADAHTTGDAAMSAAEIINYHNTILANVAHPKGAIAVRPGARLLHSLS